MTLGPIMLIHIAGGLVGLVSGATALATRKGARLHRKSGIVFGVSMMIMALSGGYASLLTSTVNVLAATLTFYLVATGWLTVKRKPFETGRAEVGLLVLGLAAATAGWSLGLTATHRGLRIMLCVFGSVALLAAAGDIRMLLRGGTSGAQRIARHLWRMGTALWIATASFFLGMPADPVLRREGLRGRLFTPEIRSTHLPTIPVLLVAGLMLFWLARVLWTNTYKRAAQ
jgi:hypothetical protein